MASLFTLTNRESSTRRYGAHPLDMQYTVFGYVIEGLDIIDSIAAVPTDRRRGDRPLEDAGHEHEAIELIQRPQA